MFNGTSSHSQAQSSNMDSNTSNNNYNALEVPKTLWLVVPFARGATMVTTVADGAGNVILQYDRDFGVIPLYAKEQMCDTIAQAFMYLTSALTTAKVYPINPVGMDLHYVRGIATFPRVYVTTSNQDIKPFALYNDGVHLALESNFTFRRIGNSNPNFCLTAIVLDTHKRVAADIMASSTGSPVSALHDESALVNQYGAQEEEQKHETQRPALTYSWRHNGHAASVFDEDGLLLWQTFIVDDNVIYSVFPTTDTLLVVSRCAFHVVFMLVHVKPGTVTFMCSIDEHKLSDSGVAKSVIQDTLARVLKTRYYKLFERLCRIDALYPNGGFYLLPSNNTLNAFTMLLQECSHQQAMA